MQKKYKIYLANLDVSLPVSYVDFTESKAIIRVSDATPEIRRKGAWGNVEYITYWFGKNAGGNHLLDWETGKIIYAEAEPIESKGSEPETEDVRGSGSTFGSRALTDTKKEQIAYIRRKCEELYDVATVLPAGRERDIAITKLEEFAMWINKDIAFN